VDGDVQEELVSAGRSEGYDLPFAQMLKRSASLASDQCNTADGHFPDDDLGRARPNDCVHPAERRFDCVTRKDDLDYM
jgi:hypothetical protein